MKADVILNDIANAELDAASINTNHASSIVPLSASCACCESLEELMSLCKTASSGKGDLLVLELNGTADPLAIIENFSLLKDSLSFSPMMQICMVDARKWGNRDQLTPIEKRQMEASSLHFLSYTDLASEDDIERVENHIKDQFPQSQRITKERLAKALISCTQKSEENISELNLSTINLGEFCDSDSGHHDEVHLLSHQVKGCQVSLPPKVRNSSMERLLKKLPKEVLRAKALVKVIEQPGSRWLFERVGNEISPSPISVSDITNLSSSLLCIGLDLDALKIKQLVSDEFGYASELL